MNKKDGQFFLSTARRQLADPVQGILNAVNNQDEEQVALVLAGKPVTTLVSALSQARRRASRELMVSCLPKKYLQKVLMEDPRTFNQGHAKHRQSERAHDVYIEEVSYAEAQALIKAGYEHWLQELEWDLMGQPVRIGVRSFIHSIDLLETIERIETILLSDNDDEWKLTALRVYPPEQIFLSLAEVDLRSNQLAADEIMTEITKLDEEFAMDIRSCRGNTRKELTMRALEERDEKLLQPVKADTENQEESVILVDEAGLRSAEKLAQEKRDWKDILKKARAKKE